MSNNDQQDQEDQEDQNVQRVMVLGMVGGDGRNSVVMHLFPPAISRVMTAVEWAKAHPEMEHIQVVLHGEPPDALVITMPRTALLSLAGEMTQQEQGCTLQ